MINILGKAIIGAAIGVVASKIVDIASDEIGKVAHKTKNKIDKSEKIKDIKRDFKLRREGIKTVKFRVIK
jgi:hypothetical protein